MHLPPRCGQLFPALSYCSTSLTLVSPADSSPSLVVLSSPKECCPCPLTLGSSSVTVLPSAAAWSFLLNSFITSPTVLLNSDSLVDILRNADGGWTASSCGATTLDAFDALRLTGLESNLTPGCLGSCSVSVSADHQGNLLDTASMYP